MEELNLNFYEGMYILDSSLSDDRIEDLIASITGELKEKGEVIAVDRLNRKPLAHPVNQATEGYYVVIYFSADPSLIQSLQGRYKLNSDIVRVMILRRKDSEIAKLREKFSKKDEEQSSAPESPESGVESSAEAGAAEEPAPEETAAESPETGGDDVPVTESSEEEKSE